MQEQASAKLIRALSSNKQEQISLKKLLETGENAKYLRNHFLSLSFSFCLHMYKKQEI